MEDGHNPAIWRRHYGDNCGRLVSSPACVKVGVADLLHRRERSEFGAFIILNACTVL